MEAEFLMAEVEEDLHKKTTKPLQRGQVTLLVRAKHAQLVGSAAKILLGQKERNCDVAGALKT